MNDDTNRPRMPPAPAKPDQMPIARARSSSGKVEVMIDSVTGMIIAAPTPAITRAMSSISTVVDERSADVGEGEHDEAGEQDVLAAPPVADRADRQEQRGEGDGVPVDHPEELALGGAEVEGQVLLGDVEAGHRRDDGHERHDHRDEDPSLPFGIGDQVLGRNVIDVVGVVHRRTRSGSCRCECPIGHSRGMSYSWGSPF